MLTKGFCANEGRTTYREDHETEGIVPRPNNENHAIGLLVDGS